MGQIKKHPGKIMKTDLQQDFIETINKEYKKCAACGECRMVCPVYGVSGLEKNVARGRLALAKAVADGDLDLTDTMADSFENCLLCMGCVTQCAGGVDMVEVVLKSRAYYVAKKGLPMAKNLAFKALTTDRKYQNMGAAGARKAQALFMSTLPETSGLRLKFSLPGFSELGQRILPALPATPFITRQDRVYKAEQQKQSVLLFVGCAGNYLYPGIPEKTLAVLNTLGVEVMVLSGQGCCGAPVQAHADTNTLKKLAVNNVQLFSKHRDQKIITICSSGGLMLKKHYPRILAGTKFEAQALDMSRRTMDISEYLVDRIGIENIKSRIKQKISLTLTYHDPCHLGRGQQITTQPRKLLQAICENYLEMPDAKVCCGLGGTYGFSHAKISEQILDKKINTIAGMTKIPARLATGCPACIMQLVHGLHKHSLSVEVGHIVAFLHRALA